MTVRVGNVDALAAEVGRVLTHGRRHEALRWVAEFVVDVTQATSKQRVTMLAPRPRATGDGAWDAMLAGVTEMLALRHGLPIPAWTVEPDRFLTSWWSFSDNPAIAVSAFTHAPAALANRGVFIHAAALDSV